MRNFRNIKAWQRADGFVILIYEKTKRFPKEETHGLTSQLRRAAVSIPANITEGASREYKKEYLLDLSHRLGYLGGKDYETLEAAAEEVSKVLHGLIVNVEKEAHCLVN